jgi:DNA replication ATP-dependent helicase/nuclease Dna2
MISSTSKRNLKASQFIQGAPEPALEEAKENMPPPGDTVELLQLSALPKQPPSTPLHTTPRLPLTHLIGQQGLVLTEDLAQHDEPRLQWKQSTPGSQNTPARKRKRARSSSPPTAGNKQFKTPKPDPASEVWSRYNANLNDSAIKASQSGLERLLIESSPRSSETAGSVGGLRRYNSCGYQWPASKKKRKKQRTGADSYNQDHRLAQHGDGPSVVSKVSLLLEEVQRKSEAEDQDTLDEECEGQHDGHSSSSPSALPAIITEEAADPFESPLQNRGDSKAFPQNVKRQSTPKRQEHGSSEYEDFDIDCDELDQLIASTAAPPNTKHDIKQCRSAVKAVHSSSTDEFGEDALSGQEWDQINPPSVAVEPLAIVDEASGELQTSKSDSAKTAQAAPNNQFQDSDSEDYGDWDAEDFANFDMSKVTDNIDTNSVRVFSLAAKWDANEVESLNTKSAIQRYRIQAIHDSSYNDNYGRSQTQKVLILEAEKSSTLRTAILRQAWVGSPCTVDSFVHIIGTFNAQGTCIIDNDANMLILHPDHLVSATVVADSFGCVRRAVLQDRVKATSHANPPMLYGNLLHEIFQEALTQNKWDLLTLKTILMAILPRHFATLAEIGLNINQVREYLTPRLQEMSAWSERFVRKNPHEEAIAESRTGEKCRISINKLLDVEEHVWSPNYGLKGNIDATVQIAVKDDLEMRTLTVPLEVKTGKRVSEAHQAQTALYTLLVSDRYDIDVSDGILYYLESSITKRVDAVRHELIYMIMKRNELACYIRERLKLPPILEPNRQRLCNGCYAQTTCYLYHKLSEGGDGSLIDKKEPFEKLISPLKPLHQTFFQKWDQLLTKEESEMMKFRRELWTMVSKEREKLNRCFSAVVIDPNSVLEQQAVSKINRFQYSFIKQVAQPGFSFAESQITVGEPIVISDELGHFALANGYVTHIHKHRVTVAVDRRLQNARLRKKGFHAKNYQSFGGIMEIGPASESRTQDQLEPVIYRIDKDEFSNGMATVRNNILQIMDNSVFKASELRSLIIEDREPRFKQVSSGWALTTKSWENEMNSDQRRAIEKVLSAEDYALVLGMPGTGKTTTIAHIIRCLVAKGKTVLLTSYTHTAVDNILLKLRHADFDVLRLGVKAKIHPEVQEFAIIASDPQESLEALHDVWHKPPVVATTCLGVNHSLFSQRTFDYCIVDEASQITLPVCLGPIRMAKSFILVGDHYQLPPLVQNKEALEGGLDKSLFCQLSEQHPNAIVSLEHQYRMNEDIMALANVLIYNGRLKCGNEAVAKRTLSLPYAEQTIKSHHISSSARYSQPNFCPSPSSQVCFLNRVLSPICPVVFINTDPLGHTSRDITVGNRTTNPFEAKLTTRTAELLMSAGIASQDLGIVTFYRSQISLLRQSLRGYPSLELHTADKFQGRDKEAVLVSFVRSNQDGGVGDLLRDWRRVNVAITRARSKLILLGSESTLSRGGDVLKDLVKMCRNENWMVDLPVGALDGHVWSDSYLGSANEMSASALTKSPVEKRTALGQIDGNMRRKQPEKVVKAGRDLITGSRPVLKDILNDVL